jgi:type I restriction enzyme S subunit
MREGWQIRKLGEVCSLLNRGVSPAYLEKGGVCVLNQKCIRNHEVNYESARRHDDAAKKVSEERFIQLGDVLVNSTGTGTLGRVAQVRNKPEEATTVDSHVTIVRPKTGLFHLDFFGYMLIVIEEAIKEAGDGCGGQTELARSVLAERFSVSYPESLVEQQRIVALLDEAFAGLATAKANAERNLQNARAIFESHLQSVFSQRGEGWVEATLGEVCEMYQPKTIGLKDLVSNGQYPVFGANGIIGQYDKFNHEEPQLLITCRGATCGSVNISEPFSWITGNAMVVRPLGAALDLGYLEYAFRGGINTSEAITGSAQPQITRTNLSPLPISFPFSVEEQQRLAAGFRSLAAETQHLTRLYERKLAALEELKKSLLHQAFNGEL